MDPINNNKLNPNRLSTNARGGGTSISYTRELEAQFRTVAQELFFCVTCYLHGHSLVFKSPVEKYFLLRGIKKRTVL